MTTSFEIGPEGVMAMDVDAGGHADEEQQARNATGAERAKLRQSIASYRRGAGRSAMDGAPGIRATDGTMVRATGVEADGHGTTQITRDSIVEYRGMEVDAGWLMDRGILPPFAGAAEDQRQEGQSEDRPQDVDQRRAEQDAADPIDLDYRAEGVDEEASDFSTSFIRNAPPSLAEAVVSSLVDEGEVPEMFLADLAQHYQASPERVQEAIDYVHTNGIMAARAAVMKATKYDIHDVAAWATAEPQSPMIKEEWQAARHQAYRSRSTKAIVAFINRYASEW